MTIKNFSDVFKPVKTVEFKHLAGKKLAIDAYVEIFRTFGVQHLGGLTNPAGEPTMHIKATFNNVIKMLSYDIDQTWCFDSRDPRKADDPKMKTIEERKEIRRENLDEIKRMEERISKLELLSKQLSPEDLREVEPEFETTLKSERSKLDILRSRNPDGQKFGSLIEDVQFILTKLGIRQIVAPSGVDAEHLGAELCKLGRCDGVVTTDPDALLFGAPFIVKKIPKKSGKYDLYDLEDCLSQHNLTKQQIVETGVALGCDYADKVPRVGAKTVIEKIKSGSVKFDDTQRRAVQIFSAEKPVEGYQVFEPRRTDTSLTELRDWLVKVQGFKAETVDKTIDPLRKSK